MEPVGVLELSADEIERVNDLRKFRDRLTDVNDERFELIVEALRGRQSIHSITRGP